MLELHHRIAVNGIQTNDWLVEQDNKNKKPDKRRPQFHKYCKACTEATGIPTIQDKEHLLLGECVMTEKYIADATKKKIKLMKEIGIEDEKINDILTLHDKWRKAGLDREGLRWATRHARIFHACGCIYGRTLLEMKGLIGEDRWKKNERKMKGMTTNLTWIALEQTMDIWQELGKHQDWYRTPVNINNMIRNQCCGARITGGELKKWKNPRKRQSSLPKTDLRTSQECINRLMKEGATIKVCTDNWIHWGCCGLIKRGQEKKYCETCATHYTEQKHKHKKQKTHIEQEEKIQQERKRRLDTLLQGIEQGPGTLTNREELKELQKEADKQERKRRRIEKQQDQEGQSPKKRKAREQKKQVKRQKKEDTKQGDTKKQRRYEVEKVMEKKKEPGTGIWLYKVRWVGYTSDDDTWEPIESISHLKEALQDLKEREGEKTRTEKVQDKITEAFNLPWKKRTKKQQQGQTKRHKKQEANLEGTHSMVLRPRKERNGQDDPKSEE